MTAFKHLPSSTAQFIVIVTLCIAMTPSAEAVPTGIPGVKAFGDQLMPYFIWLFALGGAAVASINGWRLFNGQPKAGIYALGGMVTAGLGFNGILGETATTLLI